MVGGERPSVGVGRCGGVNGLARRKGDNRGGNNGGKSSTRKTKSVLAIPPFFSPPPIPTLSSLLFFRNDIPTLPLLKLSAMMLADSESDCDFAGLATSEAVKEGRDGKGGGGRGGKSPGCQTNTPMMELEMRGGECIKERR